jgi:hypothetical protein
MPEHEHTHGDSAPHEHEGAAPGHTHDAATTTTAPAPAVVEGGPPAGGLTIRIILTLLGAAAMILGAFLDWFIFEVPEGVDVGQDTAGINTSWSIFYSTDDPFGADFITSAGFVAIILGLLALLGLAFRTGWLTRIAGALAIIAIVLYAITLYRVEDAGFTVADIGFGAWLVAAGGLIALIGGFFGSRRVITATTVP